MTNWAMFLIALKESLYIWQLQLSRTTQYSWTMFLDTVLMERHMQELEQEPRVLPRIIGLVHLETQGAVVLVHLRLLFIRGVAIERSLWMLDLFPKIGKPHHLHENNSHIF